jgi:molecular chaperone GrpE
MSNEKKTEQAAEHDKRQPNDESVSQDENHEPEARNAAAAAAQAEVDEAASEAGSPQERIHELEERLKRAVAEQENLRKRMERDKADIAKYAIANFAREVLGIADNIQRAIDAVPKDAAEQESALKTFLDGIEVTERELHKAMERHGIAKLSPEGEKFDPNFHQAMFEIPTAEMPSGMVVQVVQPGYLLEDRVLRPAMVGVSKAAPAASGANENQKPETSEADSPDADETPGTDEAGQTGTAKQADAQAHGAETADTADPAQPRGASRLNEPVINAETDETHESETGTRKA